MPKLERTTPCHDCPWRRTARKGWLGADTVAGFLARTVVEHDMPCHVAIDYNDPDWHETQMPDAPYCAGGLIFFRNYMKTPRRRDLADAVRGVEPDPKVFASPQEFSAHHGGVRLGEWEAISAYYIEQENRSKTDG